MKDDGESNGKNMENDMEATMSWSTYLENIGTT